MNLRPALRALFAAEPRELDPVWWTPRALADATGIPIRLWREWAVHFPHRKMGNRLEIDVAIIAAFLDRGRWVSRVTAKEHAALAALHPRPLVWDFPWSNRGPWIGARDLERVTSKQSKPKQEDLTSASDDDAEDGRS